MAAKPAPARRVPTKLQEETSNKLLAYRLAQRDEEKAHQKSFPVEPDEAERFARAAIAPQLAQVEDRVLVQGLVDELADFAREFSVKTDRIEVRLANEHQGEPGGIYRLGFRRECELRLMLRKGLYGPRLQATLTFPTGSSAWHRYDRIDGILKHLRDTDEKRERPRLVLAKDPLTFVRESTKGVSSNELKQRKERRIERCVAYIAGIYGRSDFKLIDVIGAMCRMFPQEFLTEHYARGALEQMYKQKDAYAEAVTRGRSGFYRLNDLGWQKAEALKQRGVKRAHLKDGADALTGAADVRADAPART